jgi:signal transduction histidine kinase
VPIRVLLSVSTLLWVGLGIEFLFRIYFSQYPQLELLELAGLWILSFVLLAILIRTWKSAPAIPNGNVSVSGKGRVETPAFHKIDPALPMIFHEIMNYASTMKGNTILMRRDMGEEASKVSLERLERATEQIQRIARGVLDISLLAKPEDMLPVSLENLIRECAENYFSNLGLTFAITSDRVALPLTGDRRKLEQVFLNLFKNSMEAGATKISVALLAQREKIGVLIEDNGKGCSSEDIARMFEAYYSLRSAQGGSGLGMFLVKSIVEGHGGTISGFSKTGKATGTQGMMFVIQFPFAGTESTKSESPSS